MRGRGCRRTALNGQLLLCLGEKSKLEGLLGMTGHALKRQMKSSEPYEPKGSSEI